MREPSRRKPLRSERSVAVTRVWLVLVLLSVTGMASAGWLLRAELFYSATDVQCFMSREPEAVPTYHMRLDLRPSLAWLPFEESLWREISEDEFVQRAQGHHPAFGMASGPGGSSSILLFDLGAEPDIPGPDVRFLLDRFSRPR